MALPQFSKEGRDRVEHGRRDRTDVQYSGLSSGDLAYDVLQPLHLPRELAHGRQQRTAAGLSFVRRRDVSNN